MKKLSILFVVSLFLIRLCPMLGAVEPAPADSLFFPPDQGKWETARPESVGWDHDRLQKALDFAGKNQTSGVVILHRGRILAEQYFEVQGARSAKYRTRILGRDELGGAIEDVASAQKSVVSILVGIAQQKGLLKIEDRVTKYLGDGWSRATPEQEQAITIRHLLTMICSRPTEH